MPSYRTLTDLPLHVEGFGDVLADVAWGGNWFLLVHEHALDVSFANIPQLTAFGEAARQTLETQNVRGTDGNEIDHIEIFAPANGINADSRNFVLCPGGAYDRSPCGTGTSAKLACLHAAGKLAEGHIWRQSSIVGSVFEGCVRLDNHGQLIPEIKGRAYVNGESTLILNPEDPFQHGITALTIR
jgi:4-hydroxyproline epimerase